MGMGWRMRLVGRVWWGLIVVENREPFVAVRADNVAIGSWGVIVTELFGDRVEARNRTTARPDLSRAIDPNGVLADRAAFR